MGNVVDNCCAAQRDRAFVHSGGESPEGPDCLGSQLRNRQSLKRVTFQTELPAQPTTSQKVQVLKRASIRSSALAHEKERRGSGRRASASRIEAPVGVEEAVRFSGSRISGVASAEPSLLAPRLEVREPLAELDVVAKETSIGTVSTAASSTRSSAVEFTIGTGSDNEGLGSPRSGALTPTKPSSITETISADWNETMGARSSLTDTMEADWSVAGIAADDRPEGQPMRMQLSMQEPVAVSEKRSSLLDTMATDWSSVPAKPDIPHKEVERGHPVKGESESFDADYEF